MRRAIVMDVSKPNKGILDFSYLNEAPAGKHGFLKACGGDLVFEDGTKIRMLGTTVTNCTSHEQCDIMAKRLASAGVNFVRFHAWDGPMRGEKDFSLIDYSKGNSRNPNPIGFEMMDYIIYTFKKHGIYMQMDSVVTRNFSNEGDDLAYDDKLVSGVWPLKLVTVFNRRLIELQKEYMDHVFNHVNQYTGLRYADDPAIAIVQVLNENSLFWSFGEEFGIDFMPGAYKQEYRMLWTRWLKEKYGTDEALQQAWTDKDGNCALTIFESLECRVSLPSLTFVTAKPAGASSKVMTTDLNSQVRMSDYTQFITEVETGFAHEMSSYLKDELGVKCTINISNLIKSPGNCYAINKHADVAQQDAYYNHPTFHANIKGRQMAYLHRTPMVTVDPRSIIDARCITRNMIVSFARAAQKNMPLVIAEWNNIPFTGFTSESHPMLTAYACLQGWSGLSNFAYGGSNSDKLDYFNVANNPSMWGFTGISSYVLQNQLVKEAEKSVDICYSADDLKANVPELIQLPFATLPFITKTRLRFSQDCKFDADGSDLLISSGFTPSADFTGAKTKAIVVSESPYGDLHHKTLGREEWLDRQVDGDAEDFRGMGRIGKDRLVIDDADALFAGTLTYSQTIDAAMKQWGILDEDKGVVGAGRFVSDTGEIDFDFGNGCFKVDTPQYKVYSGKIGGIVELGNMSLDIKNEMMTISLLAVDEKETNQSLRMLLTAVGECNNTGVTFDGDRNWITSTGEGPIWVDQIEGSISIKNAPVGLAVYALASDGERMEELKITPNGSDISFSLATQHTAIHYEMVVE